MAVIKVGNNSIGKISVIEPYDDPVGSSRETFEPWTRPSDWLDMPVISSGERLVMLISVPSGFDNEHYSFYLRGTKDKTNRYQTDITVDWGDGTVERSGSYTSNTSNDYHRVYHKYNFEDLPEETEIRYNGHTCRQAMFTAIAHSGYDLLDLYDCYQRWNPDVTSNSYANSRINGTNKPQILEIELDSESGIYLRMGRSNKSFSNLHKASINLPNTIEMFYWFDNCYNLREVTIPSGSTSNVTNIEFAFHYCQRLTELPFFDTSNVTNGYAAFAQLKNLDTIPHYDLSNVQKCHSMLCWNPRVRSYPDFDLTAATGYEYCFTNCRSLESVDNIQFNNTATRHESMFNACYRLKSAPETLGFENSVVTNSVFSECYDLRSVPKINISNSTIMSSMFSNCLRLSYLDITCTGTGITNLNSTFRNMGTHNAQSTILKFTGFDNLPNLTGCQNTFDYCRKITELPYIDTSNVTRFTAFASNCWYLQKVPNYDTSSATSTQSMFSSCYNLREVPEFDLPNCTYAVSMFSSCYLLEKIPSGVFSIPYAQSLFNACKTFKEIPSGTIINTTAANVNAGSRLISQNHNLTNLDNLAGFASGCYAREMFRDNYSLKSFPEVDGSEILDAVSMFYNCSALEKCGLSGIRVGIGFYNCLLGSGAIYDIIDRLGSGVTGQTLDVRENYGVGFLHPDTLAIATAKGWTVLT